MSDFIKGVRTRASGPLGTRVLLVLLAAVVAVLVGPKIVDGGPSYLLQIIIFGIASGAIYALIALGYTMVYGIIELINFAHGDVFTLGAFISLPVLAIFGIGADNGPGGLAIVPILLVVFAVVMAVIGLINVGIERVAYRPLRNSPRLAPLITAVGMSFKEEKKKD